MVAIRIDASALERRLRVAPGKIKRVARNALNDTAKELRMSTPDIMKRVVDRPTPFTAKTSAVLYKAASYDSLTSSLRFNRLQARYLGPGEFGERAEKIHTPIAPDAYDRYGNLLKRYRWAPTAKTALLSKQITVTGPNGKSRKIGKYFFGKPHGGYRYAGLFERSATAHGKLRRLTMIAQKRRYREIYGIRREWRRLGGPMLEQHLRTQAEHPANRP